MPKISALPVATAANLTGVAIIPTTDKNSLTVGMTTAQLRTALFAGGTGYTASDPITAGVATLAAATLSGAGLALQFLGQTTAAQYLGMANTGASIIFGIESSVGGGLVAGSSAYASVFVTQAARSLIFGTNSAINFTIASGGVIAMTSTLGTYNNVATAGLGVAPIYGSGRVGPITNAASGTIATYTPTADGTFMVGANVLITTATTHNFTVTVGYTDEGNTARVLTFNFSVIGGTLATAIINTGGAVPYEGVPLVIRAKANVAITIQTAAGGTYSNVVYNASAYITQIAA